MIFRVEMLQFSLILILLNGAPVTLKSSVSGYSANDVVSTPPEIRLSKWVSDVDRDYLDVEDEDSMNIFEWNENIDTAAIQISGFGSHEYIVSQHVAAVYIECRAQYPVHWVFHNSKYVTEDLNGIQMKTFRRSPSVTDVTNTVFIASLEIATQSNRATGNYTCRSASFNTNLSNDIFIFWEGSSPPYMVLSGKVLEVELKSLDSAGIIELPCYVSHPHKTTPRLYKDVNGELKDIPSNIITANFDPKIGFILAYQKTVDVIGRYRCSSGEDDDNGLMEVLVKNKSLSDDSCEENSCYHRKLSSGARFYFDDKTEELVCCGTGNGGRKTLMHTLFCSNPSVCGLYESAIFRTTGGNSKRSENGTCATERIYPRDFGLARCRGDGVDVFTYVYTEFWTPDQESLRTVFDWKDLHPENMVHIMIHSSAPYYNRQLVTVTCQTLHSYFSDGIKWGIKWRNGSISYFDSIMSTDIDPRLHGIRSTYLRLNYNIDALICYAPVWNSTKWVAKSLHLDIKPSKSPMIMGNPVEELTFSLNDTEKILECVSNAEPAAKIKWTRNDEEVPRSMIIWSQNGTSVLLFKTVTYQMHAVYKCIAQNEVGHAVKTFRIFVEDTRHTTWSTAFAIVIPILVVSAIAIFAFLMWKMQLQKKVVNHLTQVVFREANNG